MYVHNVERCSRGNIDAQCHGAKAPAKLFAVSTGRLRFVATRHRILELETTLVDLAGQQSAHKPEQLQVSFPPPWVLEK